MRIFTITDHNRLDNCSAKPLPIKKGDLHASGLGILICMYAKCDKNILYGSRDMNIFTNWRIDGLA